MTLSVHFGILTLTWTEAIETFADRRKRNNSSENRHERPICRQLFDIFIIFYVLFSLSARLFIV